jgi:hypothetical protein
MKFFVKYPHKEEHPTGHEQRHVQVVQAKAPVICFVCPHIHCGTKTRQNHYKKHDCVMGKLHFII